MGVGASGYDAHAVRRQAPYQTPVGDRWPALAEGDKVTVHDTQGWVWHAVVEAADLSSTDDPKARLRILGDRVPQPLPPVANGKIVLPTMAGHAHARSWRRGSVVSFGGDHYRVARVRKIASGYELEYTLAEATAKQYATRPGRVVMHTQDQALAAIGSAVEINGDWLHITKVETTSFYGALGRGTTDWAVGRHVIPKRAAKINDTHAETLACALAGYHGPRVTTPMPGSSVVLLPRRLASLAATGERVAIVDGLVLHERCGDPDQLDSWHHYVVRIDDPRLCASIRRYIAATPSGGQK